MATTPTAQVKRVNSSYVQATCTCGWNGQLVPIRTVEGWDIARRDVDQHNHAHDDGTGFFDFVKGWVNT